MIPPYSFMMRVKYGFRKCLSTPDIRHKKWNKSNGVIFLLLCAAEVKVVAVLVGGTAPQ